MLSNRVKSLGASSTLRISTKANQMRAEGIDVINLSVGEPDFPTPQNIKLAAKAAIDNNQTRYTATVGILELREAIAKSYQKDWNAKYKADNVIVATGAKQCLYNACLALLNPGDEVLIPIPYWVSYPHMVHLARGECVYVPTKEENGFRLTVDGLRRTISSKSKILVLNNPSNPTGSAYSAEEMRKIIDVCLNENIFIISDEIYAKLVYDNFDYNSLAAFGDRARRQSIIINGFSKAYSMTGWRLGFALGPRELIQGMAKIQSHATSNPNSIAQWAALEAVNGPQSDIAKMCREFESRRDAVLHKLESIPHCSCYRPQGAFYVFPNLSWYYDRQYDGVQIGNSAGLAYYLLNYAHVALVPGGAFGNDQFIRISYATSMENLEKGIERIAEALRNLKPAKKIKQARLFDTIN